MRIQIFIRIYKVRRFPLRLQISLIASTEKTSIEQLSIELFHELLNHFSAIYFNTKDFYRIAPIERDYEDLFEFDMFTKSLNHFKGLRNLGSFLIYFLWNEFVCDFFIFYCNDFYSMDYNLFKILKFNIVDTFKIFKNISKSILIDFINYFLITKQFKRYLNH